MVTDAGRCSVPRVVFVTQAACTKKGWVASLVSTPPLMRSLRCPCNPLPALVSQHGAYSWPVLTTLFIFFLFFFAWRQLFFLSSSSTTGLVSVICMRGVALRSACFGASVLQKLIFGCHSGLLLNSVRAVRKALLALSFRYHTLIV